MSREKKGKIEDERIAGFLDTESLRFPDERARVAAVQNRLKQAGGMNGTQSIEWGQDIGILKLDQVVMAEFSPSYRCPEACDGCPDSALILAVAIIKGLVPRVEIRADTEMMKRRLDLLYGLGVKHIMFIGGTIDGLAETPQLLTHALDLGSDMKVSWFSDGIMQINENGERSNLYHRFTKQGWIQKVATHVSMDYPSDIRANKATQLPPKKGRLEESEKDGESSRRFKSQYGAQYATRLIEDGFRRVVINTTVSPHNIGQVLEIYHQVEGLQKYAISISSPTEVVWTFSPWIWRPHQARGDSTEQSPASGGLQMADMDKVNEVFEFILDEEFHRMRAGLPRLLANSSGYTGLMANPKYRQITVDQAVPYDTRPEILQVDPDGTIQLDSMFAGPELFGPDAVNVHSTFGYRDREPRKEKNPFTAYQEPGKPWFANIITT